MIVWLPKADRSFGKVMQVKRIVCPSPEVTRLLLHRIQRVPSHRTVSTCIPLLVRCGRGISSRGWAEVRCAVLTAPLSIGELSPDVCLAQTTDKFFKCVYPWLLGVSMSLRSWEELSGGLSTADSTGQLRSLNEISFGLEV